MTYRWYSSWADAALAWYYEQHRDYYFRLFTLQREFANGSDFRIGPESGKGGQNVE